MVTLPKQIKISWNFLLAQKQRESWREVNKISLSNSFSSSRGWSAKLHISLYESESKSTLKLVEISQISDLSSESLTQQLLHLARGIINHWTLTYPFLQPRPKKSNPRTDFLAREGRRCSFCFCTIKRLCQLALFCTAHT